jgi:hypothetical protein
MAEFLAEVAVYELCLASMQELSNILIYDVILHQILYFNSSPDTILIGSVQSHEE